MKKTLRIGTRGSTLALRQVEMTSAALKKKFPELEIEIIEILTSGDWKPEHGETRLSAEAGGKGQFAKEIEQALLRGEIDCGVHSMKDMESFLPDGLAIDHMLPREDTRDAFLSNAHGSLMEMSPGAVVGSSSVRRQAFILALRPDLKIVPLRGNVPTRIEKLRSGQVDATILALSGLKRLGLEHEIASVIEPQDMLPAAGQGAVGIETRQDDAQTRALFDAIHCRETGLRVKAERAALAVLDGSCHTPIGAHAVFEEQALHLRVIVCSLDGRQKFENSMSIEVNNDSEAEALGVRVGEALKAQVDPALLAS